MKVYYDEDADLKWVNDLKITIVGYGIQGRAQALNMRDSGLRVRVGNIEDDYYQVAQEDGFEVSSIASAVKDADVVLLLIPDQAQLEIYLNHVEPNIKDGAMLVFGHGYSIYHKKIIPKESLDVALLAPRMPGDPIREYYLKGGGVPVFVDVYQNASGKAWEKLLGLSKSIGATSAGAMAVSFKEETELDLFIEQYFLPLMIKGMQHSFDHLVNRGFTPEAVLMELCASGEVGELLLRAASDGIYKVWQENASPTCQFGISDNIEGVLDKDRQTKKMDAVIDQIRSGEFDRKLDDEAKNQYESLKAYDAINNNGNLVTTQNRLRDLIKFRVQE